MELVAKNDRPRLAVGSFVKIRLGGERVWFEIIEHRDPASYIGKLAINPLSITPEIIAIDDSWIVDTAQHLIPVHLVEPKGGSDD